LYVTQQLSQHSGTILTLAPGRQFLPGRRFLPSSHGPRRTYADRRGDGGTAFNGSSRRLRAYPTLSAAVRGKKGPPRPRRAEADQGAPPRYPLRTPTRPRLSPATGSTPSSGSATRATRSTRESPRSRAASTPRNSRARARSAPAP